jgi:hypothetical protein
MGNGALAAIAQSLSGHGPHRHPMNARFDAADLEMTNTVKKGEHKVRPYS